MLSIHQNIYTKLDYFIENHKIPNILFYGPYGSGKKEILFSFLKKIYENIHNKNYVLIENCGHNTGIKFIREQLKFFSKLNINNNNGKTFKSVILLNADKLTSDAQSALRRCIEIYNHNTRFFIVVEDKNKLLKPIISRFCEFYIPLPIVNKKKINLHIYQKNIIFNNNNNSKFLYLKNNVKTNENILYYKNLVEKLFNKGYNVLDLFDYVEKNKELNYVHKNKLILYFDKIRKEFRNEKSIMLLFFYFLFMRNNEDLENISLL